MQCDVEEYSGSSVAVDVTCDSREDCIYAIQVPLYSLKWSCLGEMGDSICDYDFCVTVYELILILWLCNMKRNQC